jgi:uncharacterized protein (DUF1499 family)
VTRPKWSSKLTKYAFLVSFLLAVSSCSITQHVDPTDMMCPDSPKCVSSEEARSTQLIEPFSFDDPPEQAMARLKAALLSEENVTITREEPTHLTAEVRTQLFGFVDDVKFVLLPKQGTIQVRSSARMGYADMGVNRRRIERIRKAFLEAKQ